MNKYQKYLTRRAKNLFKSEDNKQRDMIYSYKDCKKHWHYALQTYTHYKIVLNDLGIIKR